MGIKGGFDANDIAAQILSALDAVEDTGVKKAEDIGVSIGQAVRNGIVEGSKGLESEIGKTYKQFQNFVRSMNRSADGLKLDRWKKGLGLAESLMKDEKYAHRVAEALKDVQATFNGTKVSGLENVLREFAKNAQALQKVSIPQIKANNAGTTKKASVESPVVQADPVPDVKAEKKKQEAIVDTTELLHQQVDAAKSVTEKTKEIEAAYEAANKRVEQLRDNLEEAKEEQDKLAKHAEMYGYTSNMSPIKAGKTRSTLLKDNRTQYVIDMLKNGHQLVQTSHGEYGFDRSDMGKGVFNKITKTEYEFAQYLSQKIADLNVGWDEGLKILKMQNVELNNANQKVVNISTELEAAEKEKESAYERMAYAHAGVFGDEAIEADKIKRTTVVTEKQTDALQKQASATEVAAKAQDKLKEAYLATRKVYEVKDENGLTQLFPTKEKANALVANVRGLGGKMSDPVEKYLGQIDEQLRESFERIYYQPSAVYKPGKEFELVDGDIDTYLAMIEGFEDFKNQYTRLQKLRQSGAKSIKIRPNQNMLDSLDSILNESQYVSESEIELLERILAQRLSSADVLNNLLNSGRYDLQGIGAKPDPNSTWADMARYYDSDGQIKFADAVESTAHAKIEDAAATEKQAQAQEKLNEAKQNAPKVDVDSVYRDIKFKAPHEDEYKAVIENGKEIADALKEQKRSLEDHLSPVKETVSRISDGANIKGIPFDDLYKEAANAGNQLATMYDDGIRDTEEYIALQYKLVNIFDAFSKSAGGVKASGARSAAELRQWIFNSIAGETGFDIGSSSVIDAIWGQGTYSIYGSDGKKRNMREIAADLIDYQGTSFTGNYGAYEDYSQLTKINAILKFIKENAQQVTSVTEEQTQALQEQEAVVKSLEHSRNAVSKEDLAQKEIEAARLEAEQFVAKCKEIQNQEVFDGIDCDKLISELSTVLTKLKEIAEQRDITFGAYDPEWAFEAAKSQLEYQKRVAEAAKEGIVYHAGVLGNVGHTMKSRPLGSVVPEKHGDYNSLTGLYTTPDWDGFIGNEWSGAPISTIDINQYKLFDARRKSIALQAHQFFDNLNGTIYGYQEYFDNEAQEMAKTTDVKSIESLYEEFKSVFVNAEMSFEQFAAFIKESAAIVKGHDFKPIDYVDIDEGIGKSYSTSALQGVSKEIFNSDSFSTRLMKMLGYEGLDTRGGGLDSTYKGGTVIFDVKPESIISTDGKWSELMSRHGVELDEKSLENEEKRRQLAFDTAKAYSQQADAQKIDLYENTDGQLALFDGLSLSAQHAEENVEELEDAVKRAYDLDNQMNFDDLLREETKQADVSDQSARLAAIKSEKETVKARGEQLRKESQSIIKEISSKTGYKSKGSLQEIIGLDPDHLQKAKKAYDDNEGNNKKAISTIGTALNLKSSNDIAKAFVQIARFPEKYGGTLSKKQAQEHLSDSRLRSNAIVPLGNGRNIVFGTNDGGPIGQDQYDTHYRIYDAAPRVFDDNGNNIVDIDREPFINFSDYASKSMKIFGMSSEQLKKLPIVQQAIQDYDKQHKEDESVIGILQSGDKFVRSLDSLVPLLTRFSDVKQEYATEQEKYRSLSEEEKNIEQEIALRNAQLKTKKEELVTEQQITEQNKAQAELTQEIEAQKEAPKVEEKLVDNKLFEAPSGQYSLFEEVLEDSNIAKESVSELNQEIQKIEELDGQISLFDKQDEKVIDTSNIPDDFRMVSVSPESTSPQIAVHDLNDIAGMNSTEEAYDQLIEGENKYQQELEETARIKKERDGQVEAFSYAAVPFIDDDEYKAVSNDDKIKLFESFVNKIAEDGMSASDAMDQLYMSMEALRKQSEAMPDNIGVDYSAEIQKLEAHVNNLGEEFKNSEQYRDNFNMLVDGIKSGSISAAQAMDKMSDAYEKWNIELIGSEQSDDKDLLDIVANKNDPRVAKAFKNMDIKKWIKGNVKKDAREELEGELYKLAQTLVDDNSEAYNAQLSHIADFIVAHFKSRESKEENPYEEVFKNVSLTYTDTEVAEMGPRLFERAKRLLGNKFAKRNQDNKHKHSIDTFVDDLAYNYRGMFSDPDGHEAAANKFGEFLDHYEHWKQEGNRKTKDTYLSDSDVPGIIENFNETMRDQMVANIEEQQEILDAKTKAAQDAKSSLDEVFKKVQDVSDRAVLRGDKKEDFEDFARQIANDSGMELGTVAVSRDEMNQMRLATIKLINKELAQSITYTYDIQENIEGVNEAFLRSTYAIGDVNKALENAKNKEAKMLQAQLSALKTEESAYGKINTNVRSIGEDNLGDGFKQKIASYESSLRDLRAAMDALKADPVDASGNLHKAFDDAALKAKNARVEIDGIFKESQKLDQVMANMELFGSKNLDPSELNNLQQAMLSFASSVEDGVFKFKGFNKAGTEMYGTLEQSSGAIKDVTVALKGSSDQLFMYGTNANRADNEWQEFKNTLASGTKNLVGMYAGFQEGVQAIRSGVEAVRQIDLAMTELKKVTDETDDSYREFLDDAGRTSAVIGSTVSDFAEASAIFARLGYDLDEASSMAETAIIYKNVADGLDTVEEASDSIISTMMAFGIEANDTMGIIDRFNAVGNNFAITSAGIGEALQRSASALYSAGNTLDESVALVTAANSVIQNPEQVGKCLPTIK